MKASIFMGTIFKKSPLLVTANSILLLLANLLDAASIFSLIVIADLFISPGLNNASPITQKIAVVVKGMGLPVTLGWLLLIFLFFSIFKIVFQIFAQYTILKTKYALLKGLMLGTFEDFFNARWYFFSSSKQGTLINTFVREMTVVGDAFSAMGRYFSCLFQIILYLIVPIYLSWKVTSITIVSAVFFVLPFLWLSRISYALGKLNTATANQISSVIQESLNLAKIILGFGRQDRSVKDLGNAFDAHRKVTLKSQTLNYAMPLMYFPFGILVLIIGLLMARRLTLPLSETVVLFYALARVIPLIGNLAEHKSCLDNFFPSYEQIIRLRSSAKGLKQVSGEEIFCGFDKDISLDKVSFAYPDHEPVLVDLNMGIPKGKMVAIVGESGTGKSTLIDLIMGFYEPTQGQITFDGIRLQDFNIQSYRGRIGYVPQDSVLFNMSIKDNLRWTNEAATEKELRHACQQANAEEFIKKFPRGYETVAGDRGVRLSGGQIQRIALARAILRKPELLILDEATSALDTYSERMIQQAIENIAKETTVVVVAHRLSTIINADYIYVLKNGRIVEEGTYKDLVQISGAFNKMVQLQILEVTK